VCVCVFKPKKSISAFSDHYSLLTIKQHEKQSKTLILLMLITSARSISYLLHTKPYICMNVQNIPFKTRPNSNDAPRNKREIRSRPTYPTSAVILESRSLLLLGRCLRQLRKICAGADIVHSNAERVFIFEHYLYQNCLLIFLKHLAMRILRRQ
jgi:hypothetical protein